MTLAQPPVPNPWALHAAQGQASCVSTGLLGSNFLQQLAWFINLSLKSLFHFLCKCSTHSRHGTKPTRQTAPCFSAGLGTPSPLGVAATLLALSLPGSKVVAGRAIGASAKNLGPSGWFLVMQFGDQAA